ncbi:MAG: AzlD domain-containing protein [Oscillospiraceae bacterium]|nr:AzlD domain-containing protein [Oscillospiraceae bacterium]
MTKFWVYLIVMAGVTYLVRMVPLVLVKKKITNRFILSFLHYLPYAVLSAMTIPAVFYATNYGASAAIGFVVAVILAYFGKSLVTVAAFSCVAVFLAELVIKFI